MPYVGDTAVFRLRNGGFGKNNGHFYTVDCNEAQTLIRQMWNYEGVQCYVASAAAAGLAPLYRLSGVGMHQYTAREAEKNSLVAAGWKLEGVMGYVSAVATADTVPLYRALNSGNTDHVYTTFLAEYNSAVAAGWTGEGVAAYVSNNNINNCAALGAALQNVDSDAAHMQTYLDCLSKQSNGIVGFLGLMKTVFVDGDIAGADADAIMQAMKQGAGCEACLTPQQQARLLGWSTQYQQALNARTGGHQV